ALGFLEITSDDGDEPTAFVSVFGQVAVPQLNVTPSDVNFGVVAFGNSTERKVTFTNVGTVEANVTDFALVAGQNALEGEFSFKSTPPDVVTIAPNDFYVVTLVFSNTVANKEDVFGTLEFSSDGGAQTTANLKASRTDKAECRLELTPLSLNYGTVPYDKTKTLALNIQNIGSSPCSWSHAQVSDASFSLPSFVNECHLLPETGIGKSDNFKIVKAPPAAQNGMLPGQSYQLLIEYAPEATIFAGAFDELAVYEGLVQVTVLDFAQADGEGKPKALKFPEATDPNGMDPTLAACNLTGKSGIAKLTAIPGVVEFDLTTVGCHSKTNTITVYNTGTAPLNICDIYLDGCSPEFKLKKVPPIPACADGGIVMMGNGSFEVEVVYAPQDTSSDSCSLAIDEADTEKSVVVPLSGAGTYDTDQTDNFTQLAGQQVDVLFVVDNSGSMSDEQNNLANNFTAFTSSAGQWETDYQIGVITTDIDDTNAMASKLMDLNGIRFFTSANDNIGDFATAVKVGSNGSGTEQGLEAARNALSAPLNTKIKPETVCAVDADCDEGISCIPSVVTPGTSYCGFWNMEFLREDATLEVVFVSDEEDGSSAALAFYVDFFKSIKGFANENLFHAHAIVGGPGGCDGAGGSASDGQRYRHVATETGGKFYSICDTNWSQKLQDIGEVAFGLKVQFFLSRPAVPDTVEVTVAGSICTDGWIYDGEANAILFDQFGSCMPQEGETIDVYYEVICYGE
ncbi:MAG: hypothetical protein ACI9OJ_002800, partial [Myxococcota bacterium]